MFKRLTIALALVCALVGGVAAQKKMKTWTDWSKKDAEKILDNSPWGQTQTETDTTEMFFKPTADPRVTGGAVNDPQRREEGATNQSINVKYVVRFFTARPIRMALARLALLQNPGNDQAAEGLKRFAEYQPTDYIIVTVSFDSTDGRYKGRLINIFSSGETSTLKNDTYLERKDGKRLFLQEYVKPGKDGFGARFIFPRMVDGQPFLMPDSGEVRFRSQLTTDRNIAVVDRRFKIADMMHEGVLEY